MSMEEEHAFLWNGSEPGWALLRTPDLRGGYCIFNRRTQVLLHVESEDLNLLLCERMRAAGCKIFDALPDAPVDIAVERGN